MKVKIFAVLVRLAILHIVIITALMVFFPTPMQVIVLDGPQVVDGVAMRKSIKTNAKDIQHIEKTIGERINETQ